MLIVSSRRALVKSEFTSKKDIKGYMTVWVIAHSGMSPKLGDQRLHDSDSKAPSNNFFVS